MAMKNNLAALVGTWRGEGRGSYPTIDDFFYTEELNFRDVGKPFLIYTQRTWSPSGDPMHVETGYLRPSGEFIIALPTGQAECAQGEITTQPDGLHIELESEVLNTKTAKPVTGIQRIYRLLGDVLDCEIKMSTPDVGMTTHLISRLIRQP